MMTVTQRSKQVQRGASFCLRPHSKLVAGMRWEPGPATLQSLLTQNVSWVFEKERAVGFQRDFLQSLVCLPPCPLQGPGGVTGSLLTPLPPRHGKDHASFL